MVDVDVLLASVNNDGQLLVELSAIFSNEAGPIVENIKEAARTKQYEALEHAAHKLKGCISIFGAERPIETACTLEMIGRARGEGQDPATLCEQLERETAELIAELTDLAKTSFERKQ